MISFPIFAVNDRTTPQGILSGTVIACGLVEGNKHLYRVKLCADSSMRLCGCQDYIFDDNFVSVAHDGKPNNLENMYIELNYRKRG